MIPTAVSAPAPPVNAKTDFAALYVHVPFCETKCGYCDFYSVALKDRQTAPLIQRIIQELRRRVSDSGLTVRTVFCGGGTPTLLPVFDLSTLLNAIRSAVDVACLEEFTVEANPATVDHGKAKLLSASGVTRVSLGAQSFHPPELLILERLHDPRDVPESLRILRHAGFTNINLDLIFGIPGQTLETWAHSLRRAIDLGPEHIACYGLTYEPRTRLTALKAAGRLTPCDEDLEADMYELALDTLTAAGYPQYETSNYARPGYECRHNLMYWRNQPYIGVGPSAAGCYHRRRYKNISDIAGYNLAIDTNGYAEAESELLDRSMLMIEMVMMQFRLAGGLSCVDFHRRCGQDPRVLFSTALERLSALGLLEVRGDHLALTRRGRLVSDAVIAELTSACAARQRALPILNA